MGGIVPLTNTSKQTTSSKSQSSGFQVSQPIDYNPYTGLRNPFEAALGSQLQAGVGQFSPYQFGPSPTAGMRPGEVAGMADVASMASDPTRRDLLRQTMEGGFLPGQQGGNPFLSAAIEAAQRPTMEALEQAVGRRIPGMFAQAGHNLGERGSSPFVRELGRATAEGGRALGDIATNMSFQAFDSERARQMAAVQLGQSEVEQAMKRFQSQSLPRMIEQGGIDAGITAGNAQLNQWLQQMALFSQNFAPVMANFGLGEQQATSSSTGTSTSQGGLFPNVIAPFFSK